MEHLVFVTDARRPESGTMEFHSVFVDEEEEEGSIPFSEDNFSHEDFFPEFPPDAIAGNIFVQNHQHGKQSISYSRGRVYCAGGSRRRCRTCMSNPIRAQGKSKTVYSFDATSRAWSRLPRMNSARSANCSLHVLRGNLYARDFQVENGEVFMEMYNLDTGRWVDLPSPPPDVKLNLARFESFPVESKGCFLIGSDACDHFYSYEPPNIWKPMNHLPFDKTMMLIVSKNSLVVTEDYLLWMNSSGKRSHASRAMGFDHNRGVYFTTDIVSEKVSEQIFCQDAFPFLAYSGNGIFALAWIDTSHFEVFTLCHCVKFSLQLEEDGKARVELVSRQSCVGSVSMQAMYHLFYMKE